MATGTDRGGTWNTTAGNKTVVATPAVDDLIVVLHGMSDWTSGDDSTITDNNSDGLGTYHKIGTATAPLSVGGGTACALWISVRNAKIGSSTSTTFTATNTGDTGGGLTVLSFSGMTFVGANAVRQSIGESTATENPPTITFGMTTLTGNPVILGCMGEDNPAALTPPTGFTEADDTGWATPTTGVEVCWDDAGNTASLFSWSGGALTDHNEVGIELDSRTGIDLPLGALALLGLSVGVAFTGPTVGVVNYQGYAPTVSVASGATVDIPVGALQFTGQALTGAIGITVAMPAGSLPFTGYATTSGRQIAIPAGSLEFEGQYVGVSFPLQAGALTFTGYAPSLTGTTTIAPAAGGLVYAGLTPTLSLGFNLAHPAGSLVLAGQAGALSVVSGGTIALPVGSLVIAGQDVGVAFSGPTHGDVRFTGYALTVSVGAGGSNVSISFGTVGSLVYAGLAPSLTGAGTIAIPAGSLVHTGRAPTSLPDKAIAIPAGSLVLSGQYIGIAFNQPSAGSILFTGYAPTLSVGGGAVSIAIPAGSLVYTGRTASLQYDIRRDTPSGSVVFTGLAPVLSFDIARAIPPGSLVFTGRTPALTGAGEIAVPAGSLAFVGLTPAAQQAITIAVGAGAIAVHGLGPSLFTAFVLSPAVGVLGFSGYAPTLAGPGVGQLPLFGTYVVSLDLTGTAVVTRTTLTGTVG